MFHGKGQCLFGSLIYIIKPDSNRVSTTVILIYIIICTYHGGEDRNTKYHVYKGYDSQSSIWWIVYSPTCFDY